MFSHPCSAILNFLFIYLFYSICERAIKAHFIFSTPDETTEQIFHQGFFSAFEEQHFFKALSSYFLHCNGQPRGHFIMLHHFFQVKGTTLGHNFTYYSNCSHFVSGKDNLATQQALYHISLHVVLIGAFDQTVMCHRDNLLGILSHFSCSQQHLRGHFIMVLHLKGSHQGTSSCFLNCNTTLGDTLS